MSVHLFAERLLARAPSPEVADALLALRPVDREPVSMGTLPSPAVVGRMLGGPVGAAISVAQHPHTSPELLSQLAKDPRKTVRRAVAAHPNTPQDVLCQLEAWATVAGDHETLVALFGTRNPQEYLKARPQSWPQMLLDHEAAVGLHHAITHPATTNVAANVLRRPRAEAVEALPLLPSGALFLLATHASSAVGPLLLQDILAAASGDAARTLAVATGAWAGPAVVPQDAVTAVCASWTAVEEAARATSSTGTPPSWLVSAISDSDPQLSSTSALELARHPSTTLKMVSAHALADGRTPATAELANALADRAPSPVALVLLGDPALAALLEDDAYSWCVQQLPSRGALDQAELTLTCPRRLSPAALLAALRAGCVDLTWRWINGSLAHPADAATILTLCEAPGVAFRPAREGFSHRPDGRLEPVEAIARLVTAAPDLDPTRLPTPLLDLGWALIRWCTRYAGIGSGSSAVLESFVLDRVAAGIPSSADAWTIATTLATVIESGTIEDFCATVATAAG